MAPPAVSVSIGRMSITSDTQDAPDGAVDVALRDGSAVLVRRVAADKIAPSGAWKNPGGGRHERERRRARPIFVQ
jgi:hypothetical protein